jgi:tRNA uridine 5-carbamoylmethylation protein Kti12
MARKRNPYVIVLQGVSGAGKSTYAKKLVRLASLRGRGNNVVVVSADDFFMVDLGAGPQYRFDFTKLGEAHNACFRRFLSLLDQHESIDTIIVDNTNTTSVDVAPYMAAAAALGWEAEIHRVLCDPEVAHARNQHGVMIEGVRKMAARMVNDRLPPWWKVIEVQA